MNDELLACLNTLTSMINPHVFVTGHAGFHNARSSMTTCLQYGSQQDRVVPVLSVSDVICFFLSLNFTAADYDLPAQLRRIKLCDR